MTKEELIRNLKYTMEKHKNDKVDTFGTNISLMCKDVLDYLEQSSDDCVSRAELKKWLDMNFSFGGALRKLEIFDRIDKELPPVTPIQTWIPVSERLPKESDGVVQITVNGEVNTGRYSEFSNTWYKGDMRGVGGDDPIAWQPLPKPYEEKRGNENGTDNTLSMR